MKPNLLCFLTLFITCQVSYSQNNRTEGVIEYRDQVYSSSQLTILDDVPYAQPLSQVGYGIYYFTSQTHYTNGPGFTMDLHYPDPNKVGTKKRPLVIMLSGGGFVNVGDMEYEAKDMARRGYVVAVVRYRTWSSVDNGTCLSGGAQLGLYWAIQDTRAAVRYLKALNSNVIDNNKIFIYGGSAGAISALTAAFMDKSEFLTIPDIASITSVYGGIDSRTLPGVGSSYQFDGSIKGVAAASGGLLYNPDIYFDNNIPLYMMHNEKDVLVPYYPDASHNYGFSSLCPSGTFQLFGSDWIRREIDNSNNGLNQCYKLDIVSEQMDATQDHGIDGPGILDNFLNGTAFMFYKIINGQTNDVCNITVSEPAKSVSVSSISSTTNSIDLFWTNGNGNRKIVVARKNYAVNQAPKDDYYYTPYTAFGKGAHLGNENYVVYNGTGNSVKVTGLTSNTTYHFAVYEYKQHNYLPVRNYQINQKVTTSKKTNTASTGGGGSGGDPCLARIEGSNKGKDDGNNRIVTLPCEMAVVRNVGKKVIIDFTSMEMANAEVNIYDIQGKLVEFIDNTEVSNSQISLERSYDYLPDNSIVIVKVVNKYGVKTERVLLAK